MTPNEAQQWLHALNQYAYPVNLTAFGGRAQFAADWFAQDLLLGNRQQTMEFEDRFRMNAPEHSEAWFEVVFWKLFNMPHVRNNRTSTIIQNLHGRNPLDCWNACTNFIQESSLETFAVLQQFFVVGTALPVVATFVAFAAPERFPMIDLWIVRFVCSYLHAHPQGEYNGLFALQHDQAVTTGD
ncbi:MAG TPA: hypothetical protein VNE82_07265 [Candidatus Binataceae bacterium]|nr:hypothetical protein [Candidatus Binataceae bacterium]